MTQQNIHGWIFLSVKQKVLVTVIASSIGHAKRRTCVFHMYNNFSFNVLHKELAFKYCHNYECQLAEMQRMCDIDSRAYEWLELKLTSLQSKSHFNQWNRSDMRLSNQCESFNRTIRVQGRSIFSLCLERQNALDEEKCSLEESMKLINRRSWTQNTQDFREESHTCKDRIC